MSHITNPDAHAAGVTDHGVGPAGDLLFAGDFDREEQKATLVTNAAHNLQRGALLGQLTADGKVTLFDAAGGGGAEVAHSILAHDIDATAADQEVVVYTRGTFSEQEVLAQTAGLVVDEALKNVMRDRNLYLRKTLRAAGV